MLLNSISTFQQLQSFTSIDQMNESVKFHKQKLNKKNKNAYLVLDLISQYSCVYFGVSFLSQKSIAEKLNISYKTVQRAISKLIEIGAVIKHACKRESMDKRQTSNILVLQPFQIECDYPEVTSHEIPQLISNNQDTDVTEVPSADSEKVIEDALISKLPHPLHVLRYYFDAKEIYSIAGTIFKAKSKYKSITIEDHADVFEQTIKQIIQSYKFGKVRNFNAAIYGAIRNVCKGIWLRGSFTQLLA